MYLSPFRSWIELCNIYVCEKQLYNYSVTLNKSIVINKCRISGNIFKCGYICSAFIKRYIIKYYIQIYMQMRILILKIVYIKSIKIAITDPLLQFTEIINQTTLFIFLHEKDGWKLLFLQWVISVIRIISQEKRMADNKNRRAFREMRYKER